MTNGSTRPMMFSLMTFIGTSHLHCTSRTPGLHGICLVQVQAIYIVHPELPVYTRSITFHAVSVIKGIEI